MTVVTRHASLTYFASPSSVPPGSAYPAGYSAERFVPSLLKLRLSEDRQSPPLALYLFWYLASMRRYTIVYVRYGDDIVHVSHVLTWNRRLAFMGRNDLQIGPSWTAPGHRSRGLFQATIGHILADHRSSRVWAWTRTDNVASCRAIASAGLVKAGVGTRRWGRYRLTGAA